VSGHLTHRPLYLQGKSPRYPLEPVWRRCRKKSGIEPRSSSPQPSHVLTELYRLSKVLKSVLKCRTVRFSLRAVGCWAGCFVVAFASTVTGLGPRACRASHTSQNKVLVGTSEGKRALGRPRRGWEHNIKIDLREIGIDETNWIRLAQDGVQWRAFVSTVMNFRVP
jgi:hypothetical protein